MRNINRQQLVMRVIFILAMIFASGEVAFATIITPSVTFANDVNGDGIAGIGDSLTFSCRSDNASPSNGTPYVNLGVLGNAALQLVPTVGNYYSAPFVITAGSYVDTAFRPMFFDEATQMLSANPISVNSRRPNSVAGPSVTGGSGPNGEFRVNDVMRIDISMSTPSDGDIPRVNLTPIGLGNLSFGGTYPDYVFTKTFPLNKEGIGTPITISATNVAGNSKSWPVSIDYDTKAPNLTSVTVANTTNASAGAYVRTGDVIKISATVAAYDSDTVTASNTNFFSAPVTMNLVTGGTVGSPATFEYSFAVGADITLESNFVTFDVVATDKVGNTTKRQSNALPTDTIPPIFSLPLGISIFEHGGVLNDNIAIIGDQLYILGNLSVVPTSDIIVTVDLSSVGGVSNQICTFAPGSTSFSLTYDVHAGNSEDYQPRSFTVKAEDKAHNTKYEITLPVVYVDNTAPNISSVQLQKTNGTGGYAKLGETLGLQANVTNLGSGGSIWTDFRPIGGTGSDTLTLTGANAYRIEQVVNAPAPGYAIVNGLRPFTVWAVDKSGNQAVMTSNGLYIDNEPPVVVSSSYSSVPAISPQHPWVRVNDTLKFQVTLASGTAAVYDQETVTINLTGVGGAAAQAMTYEGSGVYTYSLTVPAGSLNSDTVFSFTATDKALNTANGSIIVHIDNMPPTPGPMTINRLTTGRTGAIRLGERLEIIVPVSDTDGGSCTIDLSMIGGQSTTFMNFDQTLNRYYLVSDTALANMENSSYVFRALVTDKAGNSMTALSGTYAVDCVPPVINYASATFQNFVGNSTIVNVGDRVTITASVDLARAGTSIPTVNLAAIGGNAAQILYDDGAHGDGAAGDGLFAFTQTVASGSLDGQQHSFTVDLTDPAGNHVSATTESLFIDNQPLVIQSFIASQSFDNNGNTIVDLDGYYTTQPIVATDQVRMVVKVQGNSWDLSGGVVDLTPLGINNTAYPLTFTPTSDGWQATEVFSPIPGVTNRAYTWFNLAVTDVNGNISYATSTPKLLVDNQPPSIQVYPISWVLDKGRLNEANEGDVLRIRVRLNNHDGILPQIDFTNLYLANGLTPPSPTLFPPGGPNEYQYDWTVPAGLGTTASLTVIAYDASGNMVVGYTNSIRFLSKVPGFRSFPASRCDLSSDTNWLGQPNHIANPGDQVTLTCVLSSVYDSGNSPPATVLADIRSITADPSDDSSPTYADGDTTTYWTPLTYQPAPVSGAGNYVYQSVFTVGTSRKEISVASFPVKVLHPDVSSIVLATSSITCDPAAPWGIDTLLPNPTNISIFVSNENGDNVTSATANIGDVVTVGMDIADFNDPGSASVRLSASSGALIQETALNRTGVGNRFEASFVVATNTSYPWTMSMQGNRGNDYLRYAVRITDHGDNLVAPTTQISTFTVDNTPNIIRGYANIISPNLPFSWVANVGSGTASDSIIASITLDSQPNSAWIDFSAIQGPSSWPINFSGALGQGKSAPFTLATSGIDLATFTFPLYVQDTAGNITATYTTLAVDTTRPRLLSSEYDGQRLFLTFSEALYLYPGGPAANVDQTKIRMGSRQDLSGVSPDASFTVALTNADSVEETGGNTNRISILLSQDTRSKIADWGSSTIWLSMGTGAYNGEGAMVARDLAGNWVVPLIQNPASNVVSITVPYALRPNLTRGWYDAVNFPNELHLVFDRDMASSTFTNSTVPSLAMVKNTTNDSLPADYTKRFTMRNGFDTVLIPNPSAREMVIRLSPEAQDWIAMKYQHAAPNMFLSVATYPIMIRDLQGNKINTIAFDQAVPASITTLQSNFNINNDANLDIGSGILTMTFDRRARLFLDEMQVSYPLPGGKTISNVVTSRLYLYKNQDRTGSSMPLQRSSAPGATGSILLNDYSSSTVRIQLAPDDIRDILSWNTNHLYLSADQSAFLDLWNNPSNVYPLTGNSAAQIKVTFPTVYGGPVPVAAALNYPPPTKAYAAGTLFYDVEFETAIMPSNIAVPINRDIIPTLTINRLDDNSVIDIGSFTTWMDHSVGTVKRTVARFANTLQYPTLQGVPVYISVNNCFDVFGKPINPAPAQITNVFNSADQITSGTGYKNPSKPFIIDSQSPTPISVTPIGTIGITAANSSIFIVTFDEAMDQTPAHVPTLRLGDVNNTVMNFSFESWTGSSTARFYNTAAFNDVTSQGSFTYFVSSGYDPAGNKSTDNFAMPSGQLEIRSKGPLISGYTVTTFPSTTAKYSSPTGNVTGKPFSPYVAPGLATITVTYTNAPGGNNWLHFFQGNASLGSFPITISGNTGTVAWDGTLAGIPIGPTGPTTYELRVLDIFGNEGSMRGSIIYDGLSPTVLRWNITQGYLSGGKIWFSPKVHSFVKIDVLGVSAGETISMRVSGGLSTDSYQMGPLNGGGYTISYDGKSTDAGQPFLVDGEYRLNIVDAAGNLGRPLGATGIATSVLVIKTTTPAISSLITYRTDNASQTTRFNPRVTSLTIQVDSGDPAIASGAILARISAGSTVIRDVPFIGAATPFTAAWDGRDANGQLVTDGTYHVTIIDQAENPSSLAVDVDVITSAFRVTSASQINPRTVRLIFTADINAADVGNFNNYSLSPNSPAGIAVSGPVVVNGHVVDLPLNTVLTDKQTYTLTVATGFRSADDDPITSGNNTAQFTADTQGPMIADITFDGITGQRALNVVFDETVNASSATNAGNYKLTLGSGTVVLSGITMRADNKSVQVNTNVDITEGARYTITASGVIDLFGNPSNSSRSFTGRDVTPPQLSVSVFSNPGNEFDITIAVSSNEDLGAAPTAVVTQSGGNAASLIMNAGPTNRLFLSGAHLDKNYPGVVTITVTARDLTGNTATKTITFSTAFVNASMRADVRSTDGCFQIVIPVGAIKSESLVSVTSTTLTKDSTGMASKKSGQNTGLAGSRRYNGLTRIDTTGMTPALAASIRMVLGDGIADELVPIGAAYSMNIPAGRLIAPIEVSIKVPSGGLPAGVAMFHLDDDGVWRFVSRMVSSGRLSYTTMTTGAYALFCDKAAPRVNMTSLVDVQKPLSDPRPSFEWAIQEGGSGLATDSVKVTLDGRELDATVDATGCKASFRSLEPLLEGEHRLSFKAFDRAGNVGVMPEIRFQVSPPLSVLEIVQYPNPARGSRVVLRIGANRRLPSSDLVEVDIYNVAGAKIRGNGDLPITIRSDGVRWNNEVTWDLTDQSDRAVANGVYFARITVHDPDNWDKKTRVIHKIAVLR
ncbi:MAG: hypothetical protein HQM09_03300 [Candidatus Riflebacteria bacterium]|nr:hypothetical protein [Candidatus Riflebacteria bacterium]